MKSLPFGSFLVFAVDLAVLFLGLSNIPSVLTRPRIPFEVNSKGGQVVVTRVFDRSFAEDLIPGDVILRWGDKSVELPEFLEFLSDLSSIGATIPLTLERSNSIRSTTISLVRFYESPRFIIIMVFASVVTWLMAILLLFNRPRDQSAMVLHWSLILLSSSLLLTWGAIDASESVAFLKRVLFFLCYTMVGAFFLLFTTVFPRQSPGSFLRKATLVLTPAAILACAQALLHFRAIETGSPESFAFFQHSFDIFHIVIVLYVGVALVVLIRSYRACETVEERKKLQWVFWGIVIGTVPFVVLVPLPQVFMPASPIQEEFVVLFLVVIPLSLSISVLKYKLFDIQVIIDRSVAYAILSMVIGMLYVLSVLLMTSLIGGQAVFEEYLFLTGVSLAIAFLFNPLRNHVQRFVDETLFPARGNFRKLAMELSTEFHHSLSADQLLGRVVAGLERLIPATTVAVYTYEPPSMNLQSIRGIPLKESFHLSKENASSIAHPKIYTLPGAVNFSREDVDGSFEAMLVRLGISVCLPLVSESRELLGVLAIGSHPEKGSFNEEEIDLLVTIAHQAEDVLERLIFQERMIIERDEKRRAEEMSKRKSYLVSSVSHELRTPLTSIRMFAETLGSTAGKSKKLRKEYLEIIEGESVRLAHLIDNILDSAKIERGVQEYKFEKTKLSQVIRRSLQATAYLVKSTETKLRVSVPKKLPFLLADGDALEEALINLITNAVKYSPELKEVSVIVTNKRNSVYVEVADRGAGISADDLPHIFDPFYRAHQDGAKVHGSGLGLSLVKHIVEAHRGTVQVESKVGRGSRFKIHLPVAKG